MNNKYQLKILRKPAILDMTGFSKSTLYNRVKCGLWPTPIDLGARAVGFVQSECEDTLNAMIAGKSPSQIKALVKELIQKRKQRVEV